MLDHKRISFSSCEYFVAFSLAFLILKPLTDVLKGGASGRLIWTVDMVEAFSKSKAAMLNAAELAHPDSAAQLSLEVDASGLHVGAVLHQDIGEGR